MHKSHLKIKFFIFDYQIWDCKKTVLMVMSMLLSLMNSWRQCLLDGRM